MKHLLRSYLGELAWERLGQFVQEFKCRNQWVHADKALYEAFMPLLDGEGINHFYVEVGSNDGRSFSNTIHLEGQGWRGLLIEPIFHKFLRSRAIRSTERNVIVYGCAVGESYAEQSVKMIYGDLMTIAPQISDLDTDEWVQGASQFLAKSESGGYTIWAPAITLHKALKDADCPRVIGFLSIDVEGAEESVLEGTDFNEFVFQVVVIETVIHSRSHKLLLDNGYIFHSEVGRNLIFHHSSYLPK